jgi:riboflavin kinase/FMN adenylyltransferase
MLLFDSLAQAKQGLTRPTVITIGSFDGIHLGHRSLLRDVCLCASRLGFQSVVITFYPHPKTVLHGVDDAFYLTAPILKRELIADLGVDALLVLEFTRDLAALSAAQFVELLRFFLDFRVLWAGETFVLGRGREGDLAWLRNYARLVGFDVFQSDPILVDGLLVTSTRVRTALQLGDLQIVTRCLGRFYRLQGVVVSGLQLGRRLGFPTANLVAWRNQFLPVFGVYACIAYTHNQRWQAVVNIGYRPTVNNDGNANLTIEAHLLDVSIDLYGQTLVLDFVAYLRAEQRFANLQALQTQITQDIISTRQALLDVYQTQ